MKFNEIVEVKNKQITVRDIENLNKILVDIQNENIVASHSTDDLLGFVNKVIQKYDESATLSEEEKMKKNIENEEFARGGLEKYNHFIPNISYRFVGAKHITDTSINIINQIIEETKINKTDSHKLTIEMKDISGQLPADSEIKAKNTFYICVQITESYSEIEINSESKDYCDKLKELFLKYVDTLETAFKYKVIYK